MRSLPVMARNLMAFLITSVVSLAAFGLILAFLQTLPLSNAPSSRLASTVLSAGLAFAFGGFALARRNPVTWLRQALTIGLFFGGLVFVYIMGPVWNAMFATLLAGLMAGFGGWLAVTHRRS